MITIKNSNTMCVAPFLSLIFLATSAQADTSWQNYKDNSVHSQQYRQPVPKVHHEQPIQHQEVAARPAYHQTISQVTWHQSTSQTRYVQTMHQDQRIGRVRYHDNVPMINYVTTTPVVCNTDVDAGSLSFGSFVEYLPEGYMSVYINGAQYYFYEGVFYKQVFSGYQVIDPTTLILNGLFSIDIQNSDGTYTQVQLDAVGNGFVGPQGEFYPQFPAIQQLQAMCVR